MGSGVVKSTERTPDGKNGFIQAKISIWRALSRVARTSRLPSTRCKLPAERADVVVLVQRRVFYFGRGDGKAAS